MIRAIAGALLLTVLLTSQLKAAEDKVDPVLLYIPDGQLWNEGMHVYINRDIRLDMKSCLHWLEQRDEAARTSPECAGLEPREVARDQKWVMETAVGSREQSGSALLFDLSELDNFLRFWEVSRRILPVLCWTTPPTTERSCAVTDGQVYVGNRLGALLWTAVFLTVTLAFLYLGHRKYPRFGVMLLCTERDRLSLSLVQMALWTVAVGGAVLAISLMRGAVPVIPDTLVYLMGLSTLTGFTGHWQSTRQQELEAPPPPAVAPAAALPAVPHPPAGNIPPWKGLIFGEINGQEQPVFAKAQLLFWTVMSLLLFLGKSIAEGALWEIPPELVLLMGISQASFLARKELAIAQKP